MQKTQQRGSELQRGWPSKKGEMAKSGEVFSLDFLFIEQPVAAERGPQISRDSADVTARAR
jgi:hypothetical protein